MNNWSFATGPTKHLSWAELACHDGTLYPTEWKLNRAIQLGEVFELIRSACENKPIKVLSAYRTPEWNAKIGGVKNSQHIQGRALDLKLPDGMTITNFYNIIFNLSPNTFIHGLGKYKTFIHVDIRPTDKLVTWFKNDSS